MKHKEIMIENRILLRLPINKARAAAKNGLPILISNGYPDKTYYRIEPLTMQWFYPNNGYNLSDYDISHLLQFWERPLCYYIPVCTYKSGYTGKTSYRYDYSILARFREDEK